MSTVCFQKPVPLHAALSNARRFKNVITTIHYTASLNFKIRFSNTPRRIPKFAEKPPLISDNALHINEVHV
jgi:hypothetical protein